MKGVISFVGCQVLKRLLSLLVLAPQVSSLLSHSLADLALFHLFFFWGQEANKSIVDAFGGPAKGNMPDGWMQLDMNLQRLWLTNV